LAVRLLADENVPGDAVAALRHAGFDVARVMTDNPGISDHLILARAQREERVVLTFDKDFGEMAFLSGLPSDAGIILVRVPLESPGVISSIVVAALKSREDWAGNLSVIEADRIRMTALPGEPPR
jgi:predicted nuclease of predicted toxin-antitoxin system